MKVEFNAAGDYELLMTPWSRAAGEAFLTWWNPPPHQRWLDVGCGTGAFTRLIGERCAPNSVAAVDPAPAQVEEARRRSPVVDFRVADALALPFPDGMVDVVASGLVINFIPDRAKGLAEMYRVLCPNGLLGGYLWDRSPSEDRSPHAPFEEAMKSLGAEMLRPPVVPESTQQGARAALERAGFSDICVTTIDATRRFASFDECWRIQTMPFAPVGKSIAALNEADRCKVRETVRSILPVDVDGSITYAARALVFSARRLK